jgi:hypothetical protein
MRDMDALRQRAIVRMNEALNLLDEAGEDIASARLQLAIDTVEHPPMTHGDVLEEGDRP